MFIYTDNILNTADNIIYICLLRYRICSFKKAVCQYIIRIHKNDIFSGGNFGKKDANRIREIKYLTDRKEGKPGNKGMAAQALSSLNEKVYAEHPTIRKYKVLLPAGWTIEGGKYLGMLITGKRKSKNTTAMLKEASKRKNIYSNMELFKAE